MAKKLMKKQIGGVQDSSREFKIGKTTINTNKRTKPGDASFPSSTVKSVSISRNGKGVTFEKDKLGNGPYDKSISKFSTVKKKGGAIKKYEKGGEPTRPMIVTNPNDKIKDFEKAGWKKDNLKAIQTPYVQPKDTVKKTWMTKGTSMIGVNKKKGGSMKSKKK